MATLSSASDAGNSQVTAPHLELDHPDIRIEIDFALDALSHLEWLDVVEPAIEDAIRSVLLPPNGRRGRGEERNGAVEVVDQQEDLSGHRIAPTGDDADVAEIVVPANEGGDPEVGAKKRHAALIGENAPRSPHHAGRAG